MKRRDFIESAIAAGMATQIQRLAARESTRKSKVQAEIPKRLHTDHFDLYQFHALTKLDDVEQIFAPKGAAETFLKAREEGKIRFIGFSAHSEDAALAMMDQFAFDSVLFPINYVCYVRGDLGPRVVQRAKEKGAARLALKLLAHTPWPKGAERNNPKCWYKPIDDPTLARQPRHNRGESRTALQVISSPPRTFSHQMAASINSVVTIRFFVSNTHVVFQSRFQ
ncbi:MAG: hypothetical protein FJ217_14785 [Ignavibacteria bacterium]|nr:hypothetical protein [Ignavibacteria bacterium]